MSITITEVRNAASLQSDNLRMDVEINHPQHGWIPYTVDPSDTDATVDNAAIVALIGTGFTPYIAPTQVELDAALAVSVRNERDGLLLEVDAISSNPLRWAELDVPTQALWATYRTELLDVPQQTGFPTTVVWPIKPEAL
jgi:hypothetical protein